MQRKEQIKQFLTQHGHGEDTISLLAGDASFRKYWRITNLNGATLVLMDAPPEHEDIRPFVRVSGLLNQAGLRVPAIKAQDAMQGFLLLEDLGDSIFTQLLKQSLQQEPLFYETACDALIALQAYSQQQPAIATQLPAYDEAVYLREVNLFAEWFLVQVHGAKKAKLLRQEWQNLWQNILSQAELQQNCLVHRDYHADNLLWLQAEGIQRVGLLDYQDALWGDPLYDLASLLEDARRDVASQTVEYCKNRVFEQLGESKEKLQQRYDVLAAQRNCKIVGIFVRLAVRDNKPRYLEYLPRVWAHLQRDISAPILAPVSAFIKEHVPLIYQGAFQADANQGGIIAA